MKLRTFLIAALLTLCAAVSAGAWELTPQSIAAYNEHQSIWKLHFEGWLHNLPDDSEANQFRTLAKGTFLWTLQRPLGTFESFLNVFSVADVPADKPLPTNLEEVVLKAGNGQIQLWRKNDPCG